MKLFSLEQSTNSLADIGTLCSETQAERLTNVLTRTSGRKQTAMQNNQINERAMNYCEADFT